MNEFINYVRIGFNHVLDFNGYDHILFLIVLAVVYSLKQWKHVLLLVSLFTLGHSLTLAFSAYGLVKVKVDLIEFLIPVTIIITAMFNILIATKNSSTKNYRNLFFALFFGLIHGLGFSNYFKMMIGRTEHKLLPLIEFALGVEIAQVFIVLAVLFVGYVFVYLVKRSHLIIAISAMVLMLASQMVYQRWLW